MPVGVSEFKKIEKNSWMLIIIDFVLVDKMPSYTSDMRANDAEENKLK
jgi:hypothetical protein